RRRDESPRRQAGLSDKHRRTSSDASRSRRRCRRDPRLSGLRSGGIAPGGIKHSHPGSLRMSLETALCEIGKNRIEALSGGIFAIVMTLLILELPVPDLPTTAPNVEVTPRGFD